MRVLSIAARVLACGALVLGAQGCLFEAQYVDVRAVPARGDSVFVPGPIKVHLRDGATVMYRDGLTIVRDTLVGTGDRFEIKIENAIRLDRVPGDSVAAMEVFQTKTDTGKTLLVSGAVTAAVVLLLMLVNGKL